MLPFIRKVLGVLILLLDKIFSPKGISRPEALQQEIDSQTQHLALFQFESCPFCVKVRRKIKSQSLKITLLDAKNDPVARQELLENGGKIKVPCLRITDGDEVTWMYESSQINDYLDQRFSVDSMEKSPA